MTLKKRATVVTATMTQRKVHTMSKPTIADLFYRFIEGIATWLGYPDVDMDEEFEDDAYVKSYFAMEESK